MILSIRNVVFYLIPNFYAIKISGTRGAILLSNLSFRKIIVQKVSSWADRNVVKFDDEKSELIHFKLSNISSTNTVKLLNNTIWKSKLDVK